MVNWEQYDVRNCNHCYSTVITTPYQDKSDIPFNCPNCGCAISHQDMSDWSTGTWMNILEYELQRADMPEWRLVPRQLVNIFRNKGLDRSEILTNVRKFAQCLSEIGVI